MNADQEKNLIAFLATLRLGGKIILPQRRKVAKVGMKTIRLK
jgi:hypothetical protein